MGKGDISFIQTSKLLEEKANNNKKLKTKVIIALASFLAVVIGIYQMGATNSVNLESIIIEVNYDNYWNATITNEGKPHLYMHKGKYTIVFSKPSAEYWDISGVFIKEDNSANLFSILIRRLNGSVLLNSITSEPYAIIEFNIGLGRGIPSEFIDEDNGVSSRVGKHYCVYATYCYSPIEFEKLFDKADMNLLP